MASSAIAENGISNNAFPVLSLVQGHPRASSLTIADHFEKRHDNLLRSITQTRHHLPAQFNALNFEEVEFTDAKGERRPSILMTRDGFTLVVMGFTGKKALEWKLRYIEAFNRMEEELRMQAAQPEPLALSSVADRRPLVNLVNVWCKTANIPQPVAYTQVAGHFGLDRVTQLPAAWIADAVAFIQARIDAATPKALPEANPRYDTFRFWETKHGEVHEAFVNNGRAFNEPSEAMRQRLRAVDGEGHDSSWAKYQLIMLLGMSNDLMDAAQRSALLVAGIASRLEVAGVIKPNLK